MGRGSTGGPIPAQERSSPLPCDDAALGPSEAEELGTAAAPVPGAPGRAMEPVPGLCWLWAEILLPAALPPNHGKRLGDGPGIHREWEKPEGAPDIPP